MEEIPYTQEELDAAAAAAAASASEGKDAKEGDAAVDPSKKRFRKTDLQMVTVYPGLSAADIKNTLELEANMAFEDRMITETADKRNELESYIYSMRDKLDGALGAFGSASEKDSLKALLTTAEDWLYGDGFDSTKQQYTRKIEELRAVGDLLEKRSTEAENRPAAIEQLKKQLDLCKAFASKYGDDYAHIEEDERDNLRREIRNTEDWMYDHISQQGSLPQHVNPILTVEGITAKRTALFKFANPIMTKPKPKPADPTPSASPTPTPASSSTPPPAPAANDADAKDAKSAPGAEPMEQSKGGPAEDKAESK
jgi:heat shock 70kDa protein 4